MKQYKGLVKKEWDTHYKTLLTPFWIMGVIYVVTLIMVAYGTLKFGNPLMQVVSLNTVELNITWKVVFYTASVLIGWMSIATSTRMVELSLNQDFEKKCEIFHMAQPASLVKILLAKWFLIIPLSILLYIALILINSLILSGILSIFGFNTFLIGLGASFIPVALVFSSMMFLTSMNWAFSCAFRKTGVVYLIIVLAVLEFVRYAMQFIFDWQIFSPVKYIIKAVFSPFLIFGGSTVADSMVIAHDIWSSFWGVDNLGRLLVSMVFFAIGYFLFQRREIR